MRMGEEVRKPNLSPWSTWAPRGSMVSLPFHCDRLWETQPGRQDGERRTWTLTGNLLQGLRVGRGKQVVSLLGSFWEVAP